MNDVEPTEAEVAEIGALAEAGRFLDAHARSAQLPPWDAWHEPRAAYVASLVVHYLGAPTVASRLVFRSFRRHPRDMDSFASYVNELSAGRGPLVGWSRLRSTTSLVPGDDQARAHLLRVRMQVHVGLQDYAEALRLADELEALVGLDPRVFEARAIVLERADRPEEALKLHERLPPDVRQNFRARRTQARTYLALGDFAAAEAALGSDDLGDLYELRAVTALARGDYDATERALDAEARATPLADRPTQQALRARRFDLACRRGRIEEAITHAEALGATSEVERLRKRSPSARRRSLVVPYVRQDLLTCAPATLTAIAQFFGRVAEHDEIAAAICYDGTPYHAQRRWAEANGFVVRAFRADLASTKALVDAGIPFALSSVEATSAHVRVVVGYDENRGSFVFRESATPIEMEVDAEAFLARNRGTGPRAMVFVPHADAAMLAALGQIALPDVDAFARLHAFELALDENRREDAAAAVAQMAAEAPLSVTTLLARRGLAQYDDDELALAEVAETALGVFPDSAYWRALAVRCVPATLDHRARLARLEALVRPDETEPHFRERLATERGRDARYMRDAWATLRRSASAAPGRPAPLFDLASLAQRLGDAEEAAELVRLAACAAPLDEDLALMAANMLQVAGKRDAAVALLDSRIGRADPDAARVTKARFLADAGRRDDALALVESIVETAKKPEALVAAVSCCAQCGDLARATRIAAKIAPALAPIVRHRMEAALAEARGDPAAAFESHRAVLLLAPRDPGAHSALSTAALAQGPDAALRYLDEVCARFPSSRNLRNLRLRATRTLAPAQRATILESHLEQEPNDAWALRELVLTRVAQGDVVGAAGIMDRARAIEPGSPWTEATHAALLAAQGKNTEAAAAVERAIAIAPDEAFFIGELAAHVEGREESRHAFVRVAEHISRRSLGCYALDAFERAAWPHFEGDELLRLLERIRDERPGEWPPLVVLARHLARLGRSKDAKLELERARERFPGEPAILDALADLALRVDGEGELEAVEKSVALEPTVPRLIRLAELRASRGRTAAAEEARSEAFRRAPLDPHLVAWNASAEAERGDVESALTRIERYLSVAPGAEEVRSALEKIAAKSGRPKLALETMRRVAKETPWNPDALLAHAEEAWSAGERAESLSVLEDGVARFPRHIGLTDTLASALVFAGDADRALQVCGAAPPDYRIRGRTAWVHANRGDFTLAIKLLEPLVREHPGWAWGVRELAAIYEASGDVTKHLEARRRVVELAPEAALAHGHLSNAATDAGELDEAIEALERMRKLSPADSLVVDVLARRLLSAGRPEEALAVIEGATSPPTDARRRALVLAKAHTGDRRGVLAALRAIFEDASASPWLVNEARRAAIEAGDPEAVDDLVDEVFRALPRAELASLVYSRARALERSASEILRAAPGSAAFIELAACWIAELAATKRTNTLIVFVARHFRKLRDDAVAWIAVGRALLTLGWYSPFVWWMRGWERRDRGPRAAQPMLDLALVHTTRGRYERSRAVSLAEVENPHGFAPAHGVLLALHDAADGDFEAARVRLAKVDGSDLGPLYVQVAGAVRALCDGPLDELDAALVDLRPAIGTGQNHWSVGLLARARSAALRRRGASSVRVALADVRPLTIFAVGGALTLLGLGWVALSQPDQLHDVAILAALVWSAILVVGIRTQRTT